MERIMKDVQVKVEAQTNSTSITVRSPRSVCTKTDTHVAYVLGLGRSLYGWKAKKITFQMDLGLAFLARPSVFRHSGNQRRRGAAIAGLKKLDRRVSRFRPNRLFIRTFRKTGNPSPHHIPYLQANITHLCHWVYPFTSSPPLVRTLDAYNYLGFGERVDNVLLPICRF
uniref:Uncharacterized protein n=1 Tax=Oryza brachyantha TaxID=4533 RepID=J3N8B8_ORYBR